MHSVFSLIHSSHCSWFSWERIKRPGFPPYQSVHPTAELLRTMMKPVESQTKSLFFGECRQAWTWFRRSLSDDVKCKSCIYLSIYTLLTLPTRQYSPIFHVFTIFLNIILAFASYHLIWNMVMVASGLLLLNITLTYTFSLHKIFYNTLPFHNTIFTWHARTRWTSSTFWFFFSFTLSEANKGQKRGWMKGERK